MSSLSATTPVKFTLSRYSKNVLGKCQGRFPFLWLTSPIVQWVQPPSAQKEAGLSYLKEKMKEKQEGYRREEETLRSRWQKQEDDEAPAPEPLKPAYEPLAENRSSVAMSWGQVLLLLTPALLFAPNS